MICDLRLLFWLESNSRQIDGKSTRIRHPIHQTNIPKVSQREKVQPATGLTLGGSLERERNLFWEDVRIEYSVYSSRKGEYPTRLIKALLPVSGVDHAGRKDHLKWIDTPQNEDSPWILHANGIFDRFEPYYGRAYTEYAGNAGGGWNSVWLYPPVL